MYVRSGYILLTYRSLRYAGRFGYVRSNTTERTKFDPAIVYSYYYHFDQNYSTPSSGPLDSWHAHPIRCLAY